MKKQNRKLCKISYNKERDSFSLLISTDSGESWGMVIETSCVKSVDDNGNLTDPNYIHYSIINELSSALLLGYEFVQ